jgi:hypothetical protein
MGNLTNYLFVYIIHTLCSHTQVHGVVQERVKKFINIWLCVDSSDESLGNGKMLGWECNFLSVIVTYNHREWELENQLAEKVEN